MSISWEPWRYACVNADMTLGPFSQGAPSGWNPVDRGIEESVETILAFNLEAITGLPLDFVNRATAMDPSVDLVASDPVGRVHLFELKKDGVSDQAVAQLEHYLLRHIFDDADRYLAAQRQHGDNRTDPARIIGHIAGLFANKRYATAGSSTVVQALGPRHPLAKTPEGHALSKSSWNGLDSMERSRRIHAALSPTGTQDDGRYPGWGAAEALGREWSARLQSPPVRSRVVADRRIVVWLVGRAISSGAKERIRLWRRAGVDARPLCLDLTRTRDREWTLAVRCEDAPRRERLEDRVFDVVSDHEPGTVELRFYEEPSASIHSGQGGDLLAKPSAVIRAEDGSKYLIA